MNLVKHRECLRLVAAICVVALVPGELPLMAQQQAAAPGAEAAKAKKTSDQLDSLVAPIALYPDPLLAQVMAASTYPLEIVQCARWFKENPKLTGENLTTIRNKWKDEAADVFKSCQAGAHGSFEGDLDRLVSRTGTLTGNVRKLK